VEESLGTGTGGWDIREALYELQRYLSDQIAPLMVVEAADVLVRHAPDLTASEIQRWTAEQHSISGTSAPTSDYLFHAVKKLHLLAEYKLISEETIRPFIERVATVLLNCCPEEDRELFARNVRRLATSETYLSSPVSVLHRQTGGEAPLMATRKAPGPGGSGTGGDDVTQAVQEGLRRFSLLLGRLDRGGNRAADSAASPGRSGAGRDLVLSEMLSVAARESRSAPELDRYLARLGDLGMDPRIDRIFRTLSAALPGWAIPAASPAAGTGEAAPKVGAVEAMHQIVALAGDASEGARRFHEMVRAAVEQFNEGELGRAVTMLDLAERLVAEKKIDAERADLTRRSMQELIDVDRLRTFAEDASRQTLLRKVLAFFPAFSPQGILTELETEQRRERRRLLVTLLQVHGGAARRAALEKLREPLNPAAGQAGWYFQRNLLNVLRRIPRGDDSPLDSEIEMLASLGRPGQHILLIKEVMANFAMLRHEKTAAALIAIVREFETLAGRGNAAYASEDIQIVLDRAYSALARMGTSVAIAAVVDHGLSAAPALGETTARLAELSTVDLSSEMTAVARLLAALRKELPRKVFGFVIARKAQNIEWIVRALSSTPTPEVRRLFREIAQTYPDQAFAKAAATALDAFDHAVPPPEASTLPSLSGDLELFGMPSLLQNLAQSEVSGVLTLTDREGETSGILTFEAGKLSHCRSGVLRGRDAVYQLFENPAPGTFSFVNRRDAGAPLAEPGSLLEIVPLIFEGSRRYDELRQARALVPDGAPLVTGSVAPTPPEDERDRTLVQGIFARISAGATPDQCETDFFVDSYRVYRLLAHWLEEGSLKVAESSEAAASA